LIFNTKTIDLEAFTPEDKDFWVEAFTGIISFMKAQPIPMARQTSSV